MEEYYQRYKDIDFPKSKLLLWTKQGLNSFVGPPSIVFPPETSDAITVLPDPSLTSAYHVKKPPIMSPDGSLVSLISENGDIRILNAETGEDVVSVSCPNTEYVEFSPMSTFFVTWSRPTKKQEAGSDRANGNLRVWRTSSGACVATFNQRIQKRGVIQWNNDESCCIKMGTNELHMYIENVERGNLERCGKWYHKDIAQFSISPCPTSPFVAVFTPENSGKPAKLSLLRYVTGGGQNEEPFVDVGVNRALFSATECKMFWNPADGLSVLVQTQSDVDSSGESYYGSSGLFLVSVDGVVCRPVPQSKDGHVYSVQWSPNGSCFIMAAGRMPCHVTLFSPHGEAVYEFGALYRDSISWSPHGRFLCLAGFGNLGGDMNFYEITPTRRRQIGTASSHGTTVWGWSPDSRYFMTCTTAPRMNVDNGFKIFKYNGEGPLVDQRMDVVYDGQWRPAPVSSFPDRGRSPSRPARSPTDKGAGGDRVSVSGPPAPVAPAPYRPPGSTGSLSQMMKRGQGPKGKVSAAQESRQQPTTSLPVAPRRIIPGMHPPAPPAATGPPKKSKKKKDASVVHTSTTVTTPASSVATAPAITSSQDTAVDVEKRIKAVQKKLKQIGELKAKRDSGGTLDDGQVSKVSMEHELLNELQSLQLA